MSKATLAALETAVAAAIKANTMRLIRDINDPVLTAVRGAVREALPKSATQRARRALQETVKTRLTAVGLGWTFDGVAPALDARSRRSISL